jgi:hypothetical protein
MTIQKRTWPFIIVSLVTFTGIWFLPPMAQDLAFHKFADTRYFLGVPNGGNVLSNIAFVIVGLYGIGLALKASVTIRIRLIYLVLFIGVIMTGLGSAHYHWNPNNDTLVWDRMPMTIVFMSFLCATLAELVNRKLGFGLLFPLAALGIGSVLWWHYTETLGQGDLRLYFWVQYYPMLAIPLLIATHYTPTLRPIVPILIWIVLWYVIAKLLERWDYPIYNATGISGHSLKHLAAAVSTWYFVVLFKTKNPA